MCEQGEEVRMFAQQSPALLLASVSFFVIHCRTLTQMDSKKPPPAMMTNMMKMTTVMRSTQILSMVFLIQQQTFTTALWNFRKGKMWKLCPPNAENSANSKADFVHIAVNNSIAVLLNFMRKECGRKSFCWQFWSSAALSTVRLLT